MSNIKNYQDKELKSIQESLYYLNVAELKEIAIRFYLFSKSKKGELIVIIIHYLKTGEKLVPTKYPRNSIAGKGKLYTLLPNNLILKGSYKNDLATRKFFKELIGEYFHFTAFGQDWIKERWLLGNPPTYLEFANMWKEEFERRKTTKANPKDEWAYIKFTQKLLSQNPNISREKITSLWHAERLKNKEIIRDLLDL